MRPYPKQKLELIRSTCTLIMHLTMPYIYYNRAVCVNLIEQQAMIGHHVYSDTVTSGKEEQQQQLQCSVESILY